MMGFLLYSMQELPSHKAVLGKGRRPLKSPYESGLRYHRWRCSLLIRRSAMNAFIEPHQPAIRLDYSCFDRILLNGVIQVLQNPACVVGFLKQKRQATRVTPAYFRGISTDYHHFVLALAEQRHVEILMPPRGVRREEWVESFYQLLHGQTGIAVILKARENARVAVSFPRQGDHVELLNRFVQQYYFYLQDRDFGRMFVRVCPYFLFSARIVSAWYSHPRAPSRNCRAAVALSPVVRADRSRRRTAGDFGPQLVRGAAARRPFRTSCCRAAFRRDSSSRCSSMCSGWLAPQRSSSKASRTISPALKRSSTSRRYAQGSRQ